MSEVIELGDKDAAIIFREDGNHEIVLANQTEEEEVFPASLAAARIGLTLEDEKVQAVIDETFDGLMLAGAL